MIDLDLLKQLHQQEEENNINENKEHQKYSYHMGDLILLLLPKHEQHTKYKSLSLTEGPYPITNVFTNDIISIRLGNMFKAFNLIMSKHRASIDHSLQTHKKHFHLTHF